MGFVKSGLKSCPNQLRLTKTRIFQWWRSSISGNLKFDIETTVRRPFSFETLLTSCTFIQQCWLLIRSLKALKIEGRNHIRSTRTSSLLANSSKSKNDFYMEINSSVIGLCQFEFGKPLSIRDSAPLRMLG